MTIDIISDIHLDFYIRNDERLIKSFIEKLLNTKTNNKFDVLVIAGDTGHYNDDNVFFLKEISKHYNKVFVTWGNHDLYLLNSSQKEEFDYNSFNRLKNLKEKLKEIDNLTFLDGEKVEYNGITFWGSGLWYDVLNIKHWCNYMNDARFIYDTKKPYKIVLPYDYYPSKFNFKVGELFEKEYEKISKLDKADIIISHIPPIDPKFANDLSDTYYFVPYGEDIINKVNPKIWIYGHIHRKSYKKLNDCELICNPLGYPGQNENFILESIEI